MFLEHSELLIQHLGDQWQVKPAPFKSLRGVIQSFPPETNKPFILQLADDLSGQERVHMLIHAAAHQWLGHLQQATILPEPRIIGPNRQQSALKYEDPGIIEQHRNSDVLVEIILANQIDERWEEVARIEEDREGLLYRCMQATKRLLGNHSYPFIGQDQW